ncbi:unnamed protein product [Caenorhabditis auriculariae]|uniref:Macro domain-containing protein n=1 Tax=Caenorhabditis auriculariae TaxID=2777116 RepID=A0A8S1HF07_9PELO|nr:unnamed protein product [Caenorhabditis auriculariae]
MATALEELPTLFHKYGVAKNVLGKLILWNGDITRIKVDAIVNAANSRLAGGGGVDGAIHRAAGHATLQEECRKYSGCKVGKAVITSGCGINHIKNIIHTVGPQVYGKLSEKHRDDLISCYRSSLELAVENKLSSIAFCCISTGVYGYPHNAAAEAVTDFLTNWLENDQNKDQISHVVLVTFMPVDQQCYEKYFDEFAAKFKTA